MNLKGATSVSGPSAFGPFVMQKPAEFVISSRSNRDMTAVQLMYAHTRHIYVHRHPKFKACRSLLCSRIHHVVAGNPKQDCMSTQGFSKQLVLRDLGALGHWGFGFSVHRA